MAKSPTLKKPGTNSNLERVADWTKKELEELQRNTKLPICVPLQSGDYLVATYKVEKISSVCWRVEELEFVDKRSAIFYCALMHLARVNDANELYEIDYKVGKLDLDKSAFRVRLDKAHESGDSFKIDLYSSRFDETKQKLVQAKQELEKSISRAKYAAKITP